MKKYYIERALFIVGEQNSGKSKQLRSMFTDYRLYGNIPDQKKLHATFTIGNKRDLYVRMTSPHEYGESPTEFHKKIEDAIDGGRWCIASPMQPSAYKQMPGIVDSVCLFSKHFSPERIRVCFIFPDNATENSPQVNNTPAISYIQDLWNIPNVECAYIDARSKTHNGLFYADFFDFS